MALEPLEERQMQWAHRLAAADHRVGRTPQERMAWVLRFVEQNLDALSVGQWVDLEEETIAFNTLPALLTPRFTTGTELLGLLGRRDPSSWPSSAFWPPPEDPFSPVGRPAVRKLQETLHQLLDEAEKDDGAERTLKLDLIITTEGVWTLPAKPEQIATFQLVQLMNHLRGRLRRCEDEKCRRRFMAARESQKFCSIRCQNRWHQRWHRQGPAAVSEKERRRRGRRRKPAAQAT